MGTNLNATPQPPKRRSTRILVKQAPVQTNPRRKKGTKKGYGRQKQHRSTSISGQPAQLQAPPHSKAPPSPMSKLGQSNGVIEDGQQGSRVSNYLPADDDSEYPFGTPDSSLPGSPEPEAPPRLLELIVSDMAAINEQDQRALEQIKKIHKLADKLLAKANRLRACVKAEKFRRVRLETHITYSQKVHPEWSFEDVWGHIRPDKPCPVVKSPTSRKRARDDAENADDSERYHPRIIVEVPSSDFGDTLAMQKCTDKGKRKMTTSEVEEMLRENGQLANKDDQQQLLDDSLAARRMRDESIVERLQHAEWARDIMP